MAAKATCGQTSLAQCLGFTKPPAFWSSSPLFLSTPLLSLSFSLYGGSYLTPQNLSLNFFTSLSTRELDGHMVPPLKSKDCRQPRTSEGIAFLQQYS